MTFKCSSYCTNYLPTPDARRLFHVSRSFASHRSHRIPLQNGKAQKVPDGWDKNRSYV